MGVNPICLVSLQEEIRTQTEDHYLQTKKSSLRRSQTSAHLDVRFLASRTVRKLIFIT